ncbi:MAG: SCP2 sterol-binding domain-containing protein [Candidatus Bathyarchaeia archaeon]
MIIKTPREFFEKTLPSRFDPSKAAGLEAVVQMNITGSDGGDWTITIKNGKIEVKEGTHPSPEIAIKIVDTDFVDLINRKQNALTAFMSGKIQFKGSLALGLRLMDAGFF